MNESNMFQLSIGDTSQIPLTRLVALVCLRMSLLSGENVIKNATFHEFASRLIYGFGHYLTSELI
jgi:hypothetical protein